MIRQVALAVVVGAIAFLAGQLARAPAAAPPPPSAALVPRVVASPVACTATLAPEDVEALKRELRAELAPPEPPAPVDHVAGEEALAVIERAEAGGEWTDDDRAALHVALASAGIDEQRRALSRFAVAVNDQRLRLATW